MERRIEGIMYGKFGGTNKRSGSLLVANKKGMLVIDKPFKEVLKEEVAKTEVVTSSSILVKDSEVEVDLIWSSLLIKNKYRMNGGI